MSNMFGITVTDTDVKNYKEIRRKKLALNSKFDELGKVIFNFIKNNYIELFKDFADYSYFQYAEIIIDEFIIHYKESGRDYPETGVYCIPISIITEDKWEEYIKSEYENYEN